ncbi:MAG TPA: GspE/PulE family protein [Verrucomicrobiales bacterium]|nr:GspE/PulE family protein [Verrucomicrobiales bacterium]
MFANEDYIIEALTDAGYVNAETVEQARSKGDSVIEALVEGGHVTSEQVAQTAASNAGLGYVDLTEVHIDPAVINVIDEPSAIRYRVIPLGFQDDRLMVAIADPYDFETIDTLPHVFHHELEVVCASQEQIQRALQEYYNAPAPGEEGRFEGLILSTADSGQGSEDPEAPIIRMVSNTLAEAFKNRSSDIHIEPLEKSIRIRYRIDGTLHVMEEHPRKLLPSIVSRLKIMTGTMSIAEKRVPQDGRIQVRLGDRQLDLRVSTVPTSHGESVVMRILDKASLLLGLPQLGFFSDDQEVFEKLITLPDGILLVTGPTGSGKTTTLYACLNHINTPDRKIITVEDPVEYQLSGINQVMVKESIGMTFQAALRSILRQAPNIIMIGEIRDIETASIAINASLTGHLVFSTLHTNDAPGAVARLVDIGVKPFLVASAVRAIIAQRLVRKICERCKIPTELTRKEMEMLGIDSTRVVDSNAMKGEGCDLCKMTGYKGRMGIYEIFRIDDEARHMINESSTTVQLRRRARELGMRTLREDGVRKVLSGITTATEVMRVTMSDNQ